MAWQTLRYTLTSSAPLIMHNGQMANPLNRFSQEMKKVSSKRNKTDADYIRIAEIEFMAGLYMGEDGPVIPSHIIDSMVIKAAQKSKEGPIAKSSVFCTSHACLQYDGPRTADGLWQDERFRHVALVRVGTARVARTRPFFEKWACVVEISADTTLVNPGRIDEWLDVAGTQVGLCDWRPQHGRFSARRSNE